MNTIFGWSLAIVTVFVVAALARQAARLPGALLVDDIAGATPATREEQVFEYNVLSGVLKRSVDAVRFIDTLLGLLLTMNVALYTIVLTTNGVPKGMLLNLFYLAMATSTADILLTLFFVREAPRAAAFVESFELDPEVTRAVLIRQFEQIATANERWRLVKEVLFLTAALVTAWNVLVAAQTIAVK